MELLELGEIYVDKTGFIHDLLTSEFKMVLLTRPRSFGKTLLLSTIEQILSGNIDKFRTLDIATRTPVYDWKGSHVIRLDMSSYGDTPADVNIGMRIHLRSIAKRFGHKLEHNKSGPALVELIRKIVDSQIQSSSEIDKRTKTFAHGICLLIDEYDYPLVTNINKPEVLGNMRDFFASFYTSLKSAVDMIRFAFITGITRFNELSAISGMNSFTDITFDPNYSTICGFTQNEIMSNYGEFVKQAYEELKTDKSLGPCKSVDDVFGLIMDWYDGYSWDGKKKVINPVSLLNFFKYNSFGRYWYDTGGLRFLQKLQIQDDGYFKSLSNNSSFEAMITYHQTKTISPASSLLSTGYLTVGKVLEGASTKGYADKTFSLCIPNMEVRMSYAEDYLVGMAFPDISVSEQARYISLAKDFCFEFLNIRADEAAKRLSSIFAGIPYDYHFESECFYKSHMNTTLSFARGFLTAEKNTAGGEPDFVLETRGQVMVIEVKYGPSTELSVNGTLDNPSGKPRVSGDVEVTEKAGQNGEGGVSPKARNPKGKGEHRTVTFLDQGLAKAMNQINHRQYALEFLGNGKKVWAVAVSIVGRTGVKIKFEEIRRYNLPVSHETEAP
ncbi:MAG: AAA family ATPase [Deltaproteobacteria bacterium]|nr:AAA family ATPase [Deltaproteobacteria bacterium]